MTSKTIKLIVFIVLLVHGIGHFQGVIASQGVKINTKGFQVSWLLKGLGESMNKLVCLILYLVSAAFCVLAALSFYHILLPHGSWQSLALVGAYASALALILFPNALAMFFNKIGAIAVDLIIFFPYYSMGNGQLLFLKIDRPKKYFYSRFVVCS